MRNTLPPFLALAVLALCLAAGTDSTKHRRRSDPFGNFKSEQDDQQQLSKPFQKDTEYSFTYNAQIASGLIAQSAEDAADPQQQAVTRIQCQANIKFASERHGQLRLQRCRVGQQNEQMSEPEKVQPMSAFEQKNIPSEKLQQLQQPCEFAYDEGVIERVQFQDREEAWAKNIKRAVLNMIQLNLKCNNAQRLRSADQAEQCGDDEELNSQQSSQKRAQQIKLGKTFTIPEITLEGACQTTYTINKAQGAQQYNVTKTINFKKCQKIADVALGFQTQQPQPQCAQCQQYWAQQQGGPNEQQSGEQSPAGTDAQQNSAQHPCAKCDPKEVKEQEFDRSTVIRCQIQGEPTQKYALERCELLSQYVYRNSKSENGKYGSAMQTVVAATLQARAAQASEDAQQIPSLSSSNEESLMFSNEWDVDVKRFYMFGDEEFNGKDNQSPFHGVPNVKQAEQALRKLVQSMQDKQKGIEAQATQQLQRLVEMLRMSTQPELELIEKQAVNGGGSASSAQQSEQQKRQSKHLYTDALAMCGTHCCVAQLAKKIKNQEISQTKAVQALVALTQLPAPSDAIVQQMEQLCSSEAVKRQTAVKQTCWLTFGALVNELCQHGTQKNAQQGAGAPNAKQSGFFQQDQCPMDKKQQYKESMLAVYRNSDCINDKIVALSALGNSGLDIMVAELEQIIKNPAESRVVRVKAIDALRRLRVQMPRKIQRVLVPIFQNTREQPQVRTAAFAITMYTLPEPQVVDQLMYTISKEPSKQVQAFAYRTMKMMAKSRKPNVQQIAKHIKSALKLANVDEQMLQTSGKWQLPMYSDEQKEGLFLTLATTISQRSALPVYGHAQVDSQFNEQSQINHVKLYMMQQEAEQWYQQIAQKYAQQTKTRAQRQQQQYSSELGNIFNTLGIKSRRSQQQQQEGIDSEFGRYQNNKQNSQPFAMFCIRTNDVDQGFLALDQHIMSEQTRQLLNGEQKLSLANLLAQFQNQLNQLNGAIATNLNEKQAKIPTSAGIPLQVLNSMPAIANIEGQAKVNAEAARVEFPIGERAPKVPVLTINAQASARVEHIQKMECWTPFAASGVQSTRSVKINAPLHGEVSATPGQGISIKAHLPQQKIRLASAHSLPTTYTATVDPKSGLVHDPKRIRTIHNPKLGRQQHEVNTIKGQKQLGMPLHIQGHYHWPAQQSNYQQFVQLLMATENSVQVTYQPEEESPREAIFHVKCDHFLKSQQREQPDSQLQTFFDKEFSSPYECDSEQCTLGECEQCEEFKQQQQSDAQEIEGEQERKQQLHQFISAYKNGQQQYKHSLKLSAQTSGGARVAKAQAEIQAQCDAQLQFCKVKVDAERSPAEVGQKWTLDAEAQLVMPQTASSVQQLQQQRQQKPKQFIAQAQAQWGTQGSAQKQKVNIRVQGTQAHTQQVRRILQQQQGQQLISAQSQRAFERRSSFLNKFQLQAHYQLKAVALNAMNRALELLKSTYFWNSQSQLTGQGSQKNGQVSAFILIDPITQQHANVTIKTPEQQVRLQQIQLPTRMRPFALIRQHSAQQTHSLGQLVSRISVDGRAECTADGQNVQTFDGADYSAPLSDNCYSVLAKDCGSEQPQFAVLLKKQQSAAGKNGKYAQKKLKVITPEQQIECQRKHNSNQLTCKVNGQQVQQAEQEQQQTVQFNNAQKSDVTIHAEGISVRFNGRKAWLKVSPAYKNTQCGLCGHYDDSNQQEDEWRMADGQVARTPTEFHRSYALQDSEQCTQQELNQFYDDKQNEQDSYHQQRKQFDDAEDDEQQLNKQEEEDEDERDWQKEQFNGRFDEREQNSFEEEEQDSNDLIDQGQQCCCCCTKSCDQKCQGDQKCKEKCESGCRQNCKQDGEDECKQQCKNGQCQQQKCKGEQCKQVRPVSITKVLERDHAVCFSTKPVKQCPRHAVPASRSTTSDSDSDSNSNENSVDDEEEEEEKTKNVRFFCLDRSQPEARRLLRQLRNGKRVVDVSEHGASFTEQVREPQRCVRRRF